MTTCNIKGIEVKFPFEPYGIQKDYMEKVITSLQNEENAILESPTGTGKTLSLLCSSLAWLEVKKAHIQMQRQTAFLHEDNEFLKNLEEELQDNAGSSTKTGRSFIGLPSIIYASRTHSQLTQAMQELKRTAYKNMKASVLGSRDQLCIHPDIVNETNNSMKIHLCRLKLNNRSCAFYNKVERKKEDPAISELNIIDIEDIVKLGNTHKFCPYFMSKELKQHADIIFMPYNYLLDPKARKALGVELENNVVILDEAHNIERVCEESASLQIKSTDVALAIDEVTAIMKMLTENTQALDFNDDFPKDFTPEGLCALKEMLLDFEKALDDIPLSSNSNITSFDGSYIFELFEKAKVTARNQFQIIGLIDKLTQYLTNVNQGPFQRKGNGLQLFSDLLTIAFASTSEQFREKVQKCYKVHLAVEEKKKTPDNWLSKATTKNNCRVLSYWCFSPGFGMNMLMDQGIRCVILTSGTLAPLNPLISELELNVKVKLENPHIVQGDQICVKILTIGPDGEQLNCNFQNRSNPRYLSSLGNSILNITRMVPNGLLIFFPSYPILLNCQQVWQQTGVWTNINDIKTIYVESKDKNTFNLTMNEYYAKIEDSNCKGAIFMGVCRGKVSEGLDFADKNGRAVIIIGLPYPPLKDPKIILKKRYLDTCNAKDREYLKGDDWYSLEATRAVNQAIGRVIRHKRDYGAIILMDSRFNNIRVKQNLSMWLQKHIEVVKGFGHILRDLRIFFKNAQEKLPLSQKLRIIDNDETTSGSDSSICRSSYFTSDSSSSSSNSTKRVTTNYSGRSFKRKKIVIIPNPTVKDISPVQTTIYEFLAMVKKALDEQSFKNLTQSVASYNANNDFTQFTIDLDEIFLDKTDIAHIVKDLEPFIRKPHKNDFKSYCEKY